MSQNEYLFVGKISKPVGLKGEVKVYNVSNFKNIRYKKGNKLFLFVDGLYKEIEIKTYRQKDHNFVILSFENYETIEDAEKLYGKELYALKDYSILDKNEYFYSDLVGLKVINQDNITLGKVVKIEEFPAQLTLKIENMALKTSYVPFINEFIIEVNLDKKYIKIKEIPGLI